MGLDRSISVFAMCYLPFTAAIGRQSTMSSFSSNSTARAGTLSSSLALPTVQTSVAMARYRRSREFLYLFYLRHQLHQCTWLQQVNSVSVNDQK